MANLDDALVKLSAEIKLEAVGAGLTRERGGLSRGVAWLEMSGRHGDGAWVEMRAHHRPAEQRVQVGMLAYQPLSRGGRTVVIGEASWTYRLGAEEVIGEVAERVRSWLSGMTVTEEGRSDA